MRSTLNEHWIRAVAAFVIAAVLFTTVLELLDLVWAGPAVSPGAGAGAGLAVGYLTYRRRKALAP